MVEVVSLVNGSLVFIEKFGGYIDFKILCLRWSLVVGEFGTRNLEVTMHTLTIDIKIKRLKSLSFIHAKVCKLHSFYCYVSLCMCTVCVNCCKLSLGFLIFGLGRSYTMHNHSMMFLLSLSQTFKFKLIFLIVNVGVDGVIHVEIVVIDFEWDASQTITVDLVEDFVNLKHLHEGFKHLW